MNKEAIFLLGVFQGLKLEMASRAIHWADEAHRGQKRTSGEDYIAHPLRVARMGYCLMSDKAIIGELKSGGSTSYRN